MLHDERIGVACATPTADFHNPIHTLPPVAAKPRREKPAAGRAGGRKTVTPDQILRSFNTWAFKREQPTNADLMRPFIAAAIAEDRPISFVLYWGKGPRRQVAEPDLQCLDYVGELAARVASAYHRGAAITLIFTDTHARLNGHCAHSTRDYFDAVEAVARERGFMTCRLSDLIRAVDEMPLEQMAEAPASDEVLHRLAACAAKWYRGDGTAENGAMKYYEMNMIEKRAVELAFPGSFFVTFNGSEFSSLFPDRLPVFHMYSLRRGTSIKPWFLPAAQEAALSKLAS